MEGPSEADWERYWEIGSDLSFERGLRARGYKTIEGPQDKIGKPVAVASDPLVELFRDLYGDQVVAAGLSLLRRLRGDTWRTQDGNELTAAEMTLSHAQNTVLWLERRARIIHIGAQLEAMCAAADHDGGDWAQDDLDRTDEIVGRMEPLDFLGDLPLYRAIAERAAAAPVRG